MGSFDGKVVIITGAAWGIGRDTALEFAREGASAVINGSFAGHRHQWGGRVVRTEGELDPQSRMARLVIEVESPYGGIAEGIPPQ